MLHKCGSRVGSALPETDQGRRVLSLFLPPPHPAQGSKSTPVKHPRLLNLVTVMDKFRPQAVAEKGCVCRPLSSPPAHRAQRAHPVVDAAARPASPTSPVAAQPAAGAPAERRSRAGGGQRCVCTTVWRRDSGTPRTFSHGTGSAEPSCTCANRRCHKSWRLRNPPACHRASCDGRAPGGGLRPACW